MWWIILIIIVVAGVLLGVLLTRKAAANRRRSANWEDLGARGRLMKAQLAHLQDVAAQKDPATPV